MGVGEGTGLLTAPPETTTFVPEHERLYSGLSSRMAKADAVLVRPVMVEAVVKSLGVWV